MPEQQAECLVVGGGIGGTVLALALGRAGRQVLILEREAAPPAAAVARPEILAGATIELFNRLGVGERITREASLLLRGLALHDAADRRLFGLSAEEIQRAGARPHSTDPGATRRILLEEAERTGRVRVQRGVEVTGLLHEGGRVVGVEATQGRALVQFRAPLTVGDDGSHSRIRSAMGAAITLHDFPFDFFGAVVRQLPGKVPGVGQAWMNLRGLRDEGCFAALFLPIPGDRTALVFGVTPKAAEQLRTGGAEAFRKAAQISPLSRDPAHLPSFPEGFGYFKRPFGHAERYVGDGVALLGDAAHPVTPAGGQGANMSIADAAVLAEVALEALAKGDCSAQQLARYELVRRPANERSLQFSAQPARTFWQLQMMPWLAGLLPVFIRYADRTPKLKARFIAGVAQAFLSPR